MLIVIKRFADAITDDKSIHYYFPETHSTLPTVSYFAAYEENIIFVLIQLLESKTIWASSRLNHQKRFWVASWL